MLENIKIVKFGFCVLHYGSWEITKQCVDSIEEFVGEEHCLIVIVDNGMHNLEDLKIIYMNQNKSNIHFICSQKNLGFSKGNNLGFKYLMEKCHCNYIVLLNNDTAIIQKNFTNLAVNSYINSGAALIGPKICTRDNPGGGLDNPGRDKNFSLKECQSILRRYKQQLILERIYVYGIILQLKKMLKKKKISNYNYQVYRDNTQPAKNCIINGCALIFTPCYLEKFYGLDDRTFMYLEEFILYEHIIRNGMMTYYDPNIKIFHNHQASTNQIYRNGRKKRIFQLSNSIDSLNILIKTINYYDNKPNALS